MKKIDWLIILFIGVTAVFTLNDLFKPGFYTSHDGPHQVVRMYYFDQLIRDGQIPPRWVGDLYNGFGYPLFNFSYQLPWIIAEPMHLSGLPIIDSVKMTFLVGYLFSGIFMYIFLLAVFHKRIPALVGAMLYMFAPFRFSNIFVRAAIGDATALLFPPLLFLSLFAIKKASVVKWKWILLGAVSFACLLLSHAMAFFFFTLFVAIYFVLSLLFAKKRMLFISCSALVVLFGIGISSYYFFPSLFEKDLTKFSDVLRLNYGSNTYLTISQLLYSPWGYGTQNAKEGGMSLQLGLTQWAIVILAAGLLLFDITRKKNKAQTELFGEAWIYFIGFIATILIMLEISKPFWRLISPYIYIDFPWRALSVALFCIAFLGAYITSRFPAKLSGFIAICIITFAVYANRNYTRINQMVDWTIPFYLALESTTTMLDEYRPKWVNEESVKSPKEKIEFDGKAVGVEKYRSASNYMRFYMHASQSGMVRVNSIYYPGWEVSIDGKTVPIRYDSGLIEFPIKDGRSDVFLQLFETPLRAISDVITIFTVQIMVFIVYKSYKQKRI